MDIFALEQLRKKAVIKFFLSIILDLIVMVPLLYYQYRYFEEIDQVNKIAVFCTVIYIIISYMYKDSIQKNFENIVKENCIQKILDDIVGRNGKVLWQKQAMSSVGLSDMSPKNLFFQKYPEKNNIDFNCSYSQNSCMDESIVETPLEDKNSHKETIKFSFDPRASRLFDFNSVDVDDSFEGIYKGINFKITETEFTSGSGKNRTTPFKGCWMIVKSNKQFNSHTIISKRTYFLQNDLHKLDIPIPDFKKKYNVYTNNLQETSSVMSSDLCNLLIKIKNKTSMAIYGDDIILAIEMRGDLFKLGSIFKRVDDPKQYTKFVQEISSLLSIIGRLKSIENLGLEQAEQVEIASE